MKRRGFRKFGAALTAAAAAAALMPVMPQGTTTVYAAQAGYAALDCYGW